MKQPGNERVKGVGECIAHVLDKGCRHVTVGLGGSCTNDGGMGCLRALGLRFLSAQGDELAGRGANLIVTGEGRLDSQSLEGKVVSDIARHAIRRGVPVAAICGSIALDEATLKSIGLVEAFETSFGHTTEYAMAHAEETYLNTARRLFCAL